MNETNHSTGDIKKKSSDRTRKYFIYLFIILIFVQIMDAYTTSYTAAFPSKIIEEFLSGYSINEANAIYAICVGIATAGMYFVFITQYLADKIGRKYMLAFTTFGMGFSALLLALSTSIIMFTIFLFCTYLFFSTDMWLIYINEESPAEKKGYYSNLLLAFGIAGPILMPIFRSIFITENSPVGSWRGMTLFPILVGIPLSIIILITFKETRIYEKYREEENLAGRSPVLLKDNIRALFQSEKKGEYKIVLVMSFFTGLNFIFLQMAESFIQSETALQESQVNLVILIVALSVIIGYLSTGALADRVGRVPLIYVFSILMPIASIFLYVGSTLTLAQGAFIIVVLGICLGYVAFNNVNILLRIVMFEITPTERRATAGGTRLLIFAFGMTTGFIIGSVFTLFLGLGVAFIVLSIPLLINVFLTKKYIKETKGTDLKEVK